MVEQADRIFKRWAAWVLQPIPGMSLGYGGCVMARIMEGQGTILPGAPRGSGPVRIHTDPVANDVEQFMKASCSKHDRKIIRVYYLRVDLTVAERALELKLTTRTLYRRLDAIHKNFIDIGVTLVV